jgi:hypothetical protein
VCCVYDTLQYVVNCIQRLPSNPDHVISVRQTPSPTSPQTATNLVAACGNFGQFATPHLGVLSDAMGPTWASFTSALMFGSGCVSGSVVCEWKRRVAVV